MKDIEQQNGRIGWIDTAKGIGLLTVIFGHLHVPYLATWVYFFHMPLFFFLSGAVFSGPKYSFKRFLVKRIKSLIIPYFTFGFVIWSFYAIINCFIEPENSLYGSNLDMLKDLFIQEHFWTIWFLAALFGVEILYYLLDRVSKQHKIVLTVISLALCAWGLARYRLKFGSLPWNLDIVLVAQFFFHVGRMFRWSKLLDLVSNLNRRNSLAWMIGLLILNIISGGLGMKIAHESLDMSVGLYGNELLTFISAFAGIFFIIMLARLMSVKCINYLGRNTMVIFALHSRVVIVLCRYIYDALGWFQGVGAFQQILYACVTFVVIMVVLMPLTEILRKSKVHALFGL